MSRKSGFGLVEVLVSIVLMGLAVAGLVDVLGRMDHTEAKALDREVMQRLAQDKLDEIVSLDTYDTFNGDFSDQGQPSLNWEMTYNTTSLTDVYSVQLTVTKANDSSMSQTLTTLVYRAPNQGTEGG